MEARAIVSGLLKNFTPQEGLDWKEELTVEGDGLLRHTLTYLKGRDNPLRGMWSKFFFEDVGDELSKEDHEIIQNMVMDRSAVVTEEEPKLVQIEPTPTA